MRKDFHPFHRVVIAASGMVALAIAGSGMASPPHGHHQSTRARLTLSRRAGVAPVPASIRKPNREVMLSIGEGEIIDLPAGVASVWTSNPAAADVYVNGNRQLHLFGRALGESTVFATAANGAVVYAADVQVAQNISSLDTMLKTAFPDAEIHVTMAGQVAVLTGTVATPLDSNQVEELVKTALNPGFNPASTQALQFPVINRLRAATPLQVMLRVRIAEVSRTYVKTLESNLSTTKIGSGFQWGIGQGTTLSGSGTVYSTGALGVGVTPYVNGTAGQTISTLTNATTLAAAGKLFGLNIIEALDAGEQAGLVTTLAEPNLTVISGETGDFLAGGQYPIPISEGLGTVSINYQNYGVSLSYSPTVLADGNISLRVRPEVSELDTAHSVQLNGYTVPALTVRRTETTVELGSGQSFMIAGLLQNTSNNTLQKLPGAGDIPVLGNLFKSTSFQKGESELVIVVTPYLVRPANDRDIKLPTDGYQNPNDAQRLLGNMISDGKSGMQRPEPGAAPPTGAQAPGLSPAPAPAPAPVQGNAGDSAPADRPQREVVGMAADTGARKTGPAPGFSSN